MTDISKFVEEQAELLLANVEGWEISVLKKIGERINKTGRMTAAQAKQINNIAVVNKDMQSIRKELAEVMQTDIKAVDDLYGKAIDEAHTANIPLYNYRNIPFTPFAEDMRLQAITRAYSKITAETMLNLSKTTANGIGLITDNKWKPLNVAYKDILDKAVMQVTTASTDFYSAMRNTLKEIGTNGVVVQYPSGYKRRLDTSVRQAILYGAKQAANEYNEMISEELECDGIEIDWHSFPRPTHEFMQGKQYYAKGQGRTINGVYFESAEEARDPESGKNVYESLEDYNCNHHKTRIICGVSPPRYSSEELKRLNAENKRPITIGDKTKTGYEWSQDMRRLETAIRAEKTNREFLRAAGDKEAVKQSNAKIKAYKAKYDEIADGAGIAKQPQRMSIPQKNKPLTNDGDSGIIKENKSKNITTITDKAIESVPKVKINGYTDKQNEFIQAQHKELLRYARDNNDNKEVAFVFNNDLSSKSICIGTDDRIAFGRELLGKGDDLFVMHNHPRNGSYSDTDIVFLLSEDNVKFFSIVKNQGNIEILSKTDLFDKEQALIEFKRQYKKYVKTGTDIEFEKAINAFIQKSQEGLKWTKSQ